MYAKTLIFASLLAGPALASRALGDFPAIDLSKRQGGESFQPGSTPGCPSDWPMCGTSGLCYDPTRGDTCCPDGTWACPGGSFCLQQGYCCPDGLDPESCAQQNGITLTSSSPVIPTAPPTSKPVIPTPAPPSSSSTPVIPPEPTTGEPTATEPPVFTGGANAQVGGAVAAVLGGLGIVGNLLI